MKTNNQESSMQVRRNTECTATSNRPMRNLAVVLAAWVLISWISGVPL